MAARIAAAKKAENRIFISRSPADGVPVVAQRLRFQRQTMPRVTPRLSNSTENPMKTITKAFGIASLLVLPVVAQVTETTETTETTEHEDGSVTETTTTTTRTFDPALRTKVVSYFDPYKEERYGLPPGVYTDEVVTKIPTAWRTTAIAPGVVVTEKERPYLVAAPPKLISLLPPAEERHVKYYVAGGNVVAVDKEYRVVDSVHIPTVKFTVEE